MTDQMTHTFGAALSVGINLLLAILFLARMKGMARTEQWLGMVLIFFIFPLFYLLIRGVRTHRPALYFIQIGLMIAFLLLELLLDYILKSDFRQNTGILIPYLALFFAGTGGMVGVAAHGGKGWLWLSAVTFLLMTALSIIQHFTTGQ